MTSRPSRGPLMAAGIVTLVLVIVGSAVSAPDTIYGAPQSAPLLQRGEDSPCVPEEYKFAEPSVLLLGETTTITLRSTVLCAGETFPLHIVLVLDASGSMRGTPTKQMKDAAIKLVNRLNLRDHTETKMGVVEFHSIARRLTDLTNDEGRVITGIRRVGSSGGTAIDLGIKEGLKVLVRGRGRGSAGSAEVHEVMVVLSDGGNNAGCDPVLQAARQAKSQGILVVTVCVGAACDANCMRQAASSPRYFYYVEDASGLLRVFELIRREILNITLKKLTVKDVIPDNMRYVPNSADPKPKSVSPSGDILEWQTNYVPRDGLTLTFVVEPLEPGHWPTNVEATGRFKDNQNREGGFVFGIPWVSVFRPASIPTPTSPPPTPTITPTFTPGPTPTPTNTPTPTPTPEPEPIYLPILVWHPCVPEGWYSNVALVLDISTSMERRTRAGRTKLEASLEQARLFTSQMRFEPDAYGRHDQVAIVGFNRHAWIEQGLTNDRRAIRAAIDDLPRGKAEYTRLDRALAAGAAALAEENGQPLNGKVLILVTDGLPNQVPYSPIDGTMETTVVEHAAAAKQAGARIYTVAIGAPEDTHPGLLKTVATHPNLYYYEPDPEDLAHVYSEIGGTFGCPHDRREWPGPWPDRAR